MNDNDVERYILKRLFNLNYSNKLGIFQIKILNLQKNKPVRVSLMKILDCFLLSTAHSGGHLGG